MGREQIKGKRFIWVTAIVIQLVCFFPWISIAGGRYTTVTYMVHLLRTGEAMGQLTKEMITFPALAELVGNDLFSQSAIFFGQVILLFIVHMLCLLHLLLFIKGRNVMFCYIPALVCSSMVIFMELSGPLFPMGDYLMIFYPLVVIVALTVMYLGSKMAEEIDEANEALRESKIAEKEAKEEKKRRLRFTGKFSGLFYQVIWKNFKGSIGTYKVFVLIGTLSVSFLFAGFGLKEMLSGAHGEENLLMAQGLSSTMAGFVAVALVMSVVLVTMVLLFYLKNHVSHYSLFLNLGMRKQTLVLFVGIELFSCMIISLLAGSVLGNVLIFLCRTLILRTASVDLTLGSVGIKAYLWTLLSTFGVFVVSVMATHDVYLDTGGSASRYKAVERERMPGRLSPVFLVIGAVMVIVSAGYLGSRNAAEGIGTLAVFFAGFYLLMKHAWNLYLKFRRKNASLYYGRLLDRNYFYYHFKTAYRYVFSICVLHICVLFVFGKSIASSAIAEDAAKQIHHDYVCMATEKDEDFFRDMEQKYDAEVVSYPMMRVTNVDNSELPDDYRRVFMQQGQHIGISVSTYEKMCQAAGQQAKKLELAEDGSEIYVLYQQDESVKAHPLDYYEKSTGPYLRVGQPVFSYFFLEREQVYPRRKIVGLEINNLIGNLRQGQHENIVVFSDAYFEKMQDDWKRTSLVDGLPMTEDMQVEDVTMHQWPTKLVLMNVQDDKLDAVDKELDTFRKHHAYDDKIDSNVKSVYSGRDRVADLSAERFMNSMVNAFIIGIMMIVSLVLMHLKIESEVTEKKRQQEFLKCMGMRRKERIHVLKKEVQFFLWVPFAAAAVIVPVFTVMIFRLRQYTAADCTGYLKVWGVLCVIYVAVQFAGMKLLEHNMIRRVEVKE